MGLDILIESKTTKESRILSRQFCREMIDEKESDNSLLGQIFEFYGANTLVLDEMNVWDVEKRIWDGNTSITAEEFKKKT